ncbi:MAG: hypothetical protein LBR77_05410 [Lachnospiraceae bacterium]|nr:hypothetical protein [Lachnospiraceae bacterium]
MVLILAISLHIRLRCLVSLASSSIDNPIRFVLNEAIQRIWIEKGMEDEEMTKIIEKYVEEHGIADALRAAGKLEGIAEVSP